MRQVLTFCSALAMCAFVAQAEVTHPEVPKRHPHAADSRSPHPAERRHPHEAVKHDRPQKPLQHVVGDHEDPHKAAKH
jgi:hypothetical protein